MSSYPHTKLLFYSLCEGCAEDACASSYFGLPQGDAHTGGVSRGGIAAQLDEAHSSDPLLRLLSSRRFLLLRLLLFRQWAVPLSVLGALVLATP